MSSYINNFKATDFNKRRTEASRVASLHPDRCSIIVGKVDDANVPEIDKHKFLVPKDLTVGQFSHVIRRRIDVRPETALFLFCGKILPSASATIGETHDKYKDTDEFLYISYASENTFGST